MAELLTVSSTTAPPAQKSIIRVSSPESKTSRSIDAAASGRVGAGGEALVSEEVKETLGKGMRIISDIEQTRPDGIVFKFEVDLMYEVSA